MHWRHNASGSKAVFLSVHTDRELLRIPGARLIAISGNLLLEGHMIFVCGTGVRLNKLAADFETAVRDTDVSRRKAQPTAISGDLRYSVPTREIGSRAAVIEKARLGVDGQRHDSRRGVEIRSSLGFTSTNGHPWKRCAFEGFLRRNRRNDSLRSSRLWRRRRRFPGAWLGRWNEGRLHGRRATRPNVTLK